MSKKILFLLLLLNLSLASCVTGFKRDFSYLLNEKYHLSICEDLEEQMPDLFPYFGQYRNYRKHSYTDYFDKNKSVADFIITMDNNKPVATGSVLLYLKDNNKPLVNVTFSDVYGVVDNVNGGWLSSNEGLDQGEKYFFQLREWIRFRFLITIDGVVENTYLTFEYYYTERYDFPQEFIQDTNI